MKIYTKGGDKGQTSLVGGSRVSKADIRLDAYGTVDELNSFIGLIRSGDGENPRKEELREIQNRLFTIGSELASEPVEEGKKPKVRIPVLIQEDVEALEKAIDEIETGLEPLRNFILPGGDLTSSYCHLARCVCRRAERRVTELSQNSAVDDKILQYLNRLSDYLFVLARYFTKINKGEETLWKTRG